MYELDLKIKPSLEKLIEAPNIVPLLDEDDVKKIGVLALDGYMEDKQSRIEWEERSAVAMKLALQVKEEKTFPWPNAANVKFPLVTVAAIQHHALAYPALISGTDIVKCRVIGEDRDGQKAARALRVSTHMSWQCLEQDVRWEEEHDKLLLVQAISGCGFIKKLFDPVKAHIVTDLVLPNNFVVSYFTKDLQTSPRYTHVFPLSQNAIRVRELDGRYAEVEVPKSEPILTDELDLAKQEREGVRPPPQGLTTPYETGEQYCWLDLDGDNYAEPYIVTFDIGTGRVRAIVARYLPSGIKRQGGKEDGEILEINPIRVFTKYGFIPSPDGGFYDLGLGMLLGPSNESVNTAFNQIFDAGTMATLGGGFVGRGFKGRGGPFTFRPFEWYPVDAPGDDLRKNVLPLPVREPSAVLFQVIGLLLQYGQMLVGATDIRMGENPGQNTPAETTRTLNANGARAENAIYKRTWRSMRDEHRVQYDLNKLFLPADEEYEDLTRGTGAMVLKTDYSGQSLDVKPAADPYIVSDSERIERAGIVFKNAISGVPGHNRYECTKNLYQAMQISNIDRFLPPPTQQGPDGKPQPAADYPPMPNPKMMKVQVDQAKVQLQAQQMKIDQQNMMLELQDKRQKTQAEIIELYAKAELELSQAKGVDTGHQIALIEARIGALKERNDDLLKLIEIVQKGMEKGGDTGPEGAGPGMEAASVHPAVSQVAQGLRGNGQGGMAGGGIPIQ